MRLDNQNYSRTFHNTTKAIITINGDIIIQTSQNRITGKIFPNKTFTTTLPITNTIHKWITSLMDSKRLAHLFK